MRSGLLVLLTIIVLLGGLLSAKVLNVGRNVLTRERSIIAQLSDFLFRGNATLEGEKENRINILLMAIGGEGHKGENLADTIMVASIRPQEKDVAILSIPRDLYVRMPDSEFFTKINAVHGYKESAKKGDGPIYLQKKVEEITGLPIHYYGRVDFAAFKRIVDELGGVDITIHSGFYDYFHKISFPAGTEHMNGERALAFARARYVEGTEGGDFKRNERQQQLLFAMRDKAFSVNTVFDLRALTGILDALGDNVTTNFELWELRRLFELTRDIPQDHTRSAVLTTGPNGLLVGGTEILDGEPAAILRPRAGNENFEDIQRFAQNIFAEAKVSPPASESPQATATPSAPPRPSPSPTVAPSPSASPTVAEKPSVDVRNGTTITGLAARAGKAVEKASFTVQSIGNAAKRDREKTVVVDLTGGKKPDRLKELLSTLGVQTAVTFPESEAVSTADFLVLLGKDAGERFK